MTDQPGDLLNEAGRLFDAVLKQAVGGGRPRDDRPREDRSREDGPRRDRSGDEGDAWARATAEPPRFATGAPECCHCPICRAIAVSRESGRDVGGHVREAGRSLMAAALDVVSAFDRTRPDAGRSDAGRAADANRNRPPRPRDASAGPEAGRSDRSGRSPRGEAPREEPPAGAGRGRREPGDPWAAATGDPTDIG